ncbi:DcaP family trimeric outer membrane transporter [Lysobacter sp. GCM10012299]|uniref:DcaP family trimeric outer membrane transporter n=1 Tax=Lysobacter sp. GCM10012299 TaxID=3317333 RepID=UPI003622C4B6
MRQQLQQQQQMMQKMQQRLDELESREAQAKAAPPPTAPTAAPTPVIASATGPAPEESRIHRPPSALPATAEPLPEGYVQLGDTGNLIKIDVVAQFDMMFDNKFMGAKDLFVPSSIPVQGQPFHDSDSRSNLSAKQSVFRLDFRRQTDYGLLKVVYKNNFFGSGSGDMPYNMQYLYGELEAKDYSLIAGYYLSAFTDIDAFPNTLDYEGPNSFTFKYTPQVRYSPIVYRAGEGKLTIPMSIEKPNADIAQIGDFETYSRIPDLTLGLRWETPDWHIQWANLFRDLGVQSAIGDVQRNTDAYATQLSFAAGLFDNDSVQAWASYGSGYANFLQDISGFGLDAAFNANADLKAIDAGGWGLGYTHGWTDNVSSSASYGYLRIDPDEDMLIDPTLPKSTRFASLNLAWQFSERAMLGAEYLWGKNTDLNDNDGEAQRLQVTLRYDLNP